jgi:putative transcriptional regulator
MGSAIVESLQQLAGALERGEDLGEKFTLRTVVMKLQVVPFEPQDVLAVRETLGASQIIFALFLGISPKTVRGWEQGIVKPSGIACRFLDEIRRNPDYWRQRLRESIEVKKPA